MSVSNPHRRNGISGCRGETLKGTAYNLRTKSGAEQDGEGKVL